MDFTSLPDRSQIFTELTNENYSNLDQLSTIQICKIFSKEDLQPQAAVSNAIPEIIKAINLIYSRLKNEGRLFYIGAGTSGRLGVMDAAECPPTFCTDPEMVQGVIAGGDRSLIQSSEDLEDSTTLSISDLKQRNFSSNDVLVGITAGGSTPYVISALTYAKHMKASTIAISSVPQIDSFIPCDIDIRLLTGPELIAGSTRLKAGTATKMTLNMISTIVMIKLGKVLGNQMIDLAVNNNKLFDRAIRIIQKISDIEREDAIKLLKITNGSVKLAILMSLKKLNLQEAKILLKDNNEILKNIYREIN